MIAPKPKIYTFTSTDASAGVRLDKWLQEQMEHAGNPLSRQRVQQLLEEGHISCLSQPAKASASTKIKANQQWQLTLPAPVAISLEPENIPLDIVYEDEHLLVINKPVGMPVHPSAGHDSGTLVHALLHHCGDSLSGIGGELRPGIVHRIDMETSGLIVVAKHDRAHQHLSDQLKTRTLSRTYLAYCWGVPAGVTGADGRLTGTIEGAIGRDPHHRKKMAVVEKNGKEARTFYTVERAYSAPHKDGGMHPLAAKITCKLDTGRTHQIRVHMAHLGHGLIGDPLYGMRANQRLRHVRLAAEHDTLLTGALKECNRQALHAYQLRLNHPKNNEEIAFSAPPPADLEQLETALETLAK